jgi:hypothetical protein
VGSARERFCAFHILFKVQKMRWISRVSLVLVSASINKIGAFCGLSASEATKSNSSSLALPCRATMPEPTRLLAIWNICSPETSATFFNSGTGTVAAV